MLKQEYIQLLRQMISIPSLSFEEGAVCSFISDYLTASGLPHTRERNNLLALNAGFSPDKPTLALVAHIDTVPPAQGYTRDPYDSGKSEEIIYGLGSNDDGGSVVTMIAAFGHFYGRQLPVNLMLVLSCEEERSGDNGSSHLFAENGYFANSGTFPYPDWAIVGEPTGMKAATSERGLLVIDGHARGISGHAARGEGKNALYTALEDIDRLRKHRFGKISATMGEVRLNVTQINAGTAHNVIPDSCSFVVDIRPTDSYTNEELLQELQALCESELKARNLKNRSSATPSDSLLMKTVQAAGMESFSSPTTSDWIRIGCEAVKIGPGDSSRSHKADEYILVEELHKGFDLYIDFINTFCNGYTLE